MERKYKRSGGNNMTTTDEMKEKLIKENEEILNKIKEIEDTAKPLKKQLEMNKEVLAVINKQSYKPDKSKRKYTKKKLPDIEVSLDGV